MSAQSAFAAHFAGHAGDFGGERSQLLDHGVEGFFQLQDFAAHIDRNFLRQVAVRDRRRDLGNVAHLASQVAGHEVHFVGEILPRTGHSGDLSLSAEFAVGPDLPRHTRDLAGECFHVHRDLARQVAAGHRGGNFGDVAHLCRKVPRHRVDGIRKILPGSSDSGDVSLAAQPPFSSHFPGHTRYFSRERVELVHHGVDGFLEQQNFAAHVDRDLLR